MRTRAGFSTEAIYIFHNMVRRVLNQYKPEYVAAIFESAGPTFRDAVYEQYKANRDETPPDLIAQIPGVRRALEAMRIPVLEYPGYEADDVIGTLARAAVEHGIETVIVSSDKDMLQLVNDHVSMLNPMKDDTLYDEAKTVEFMGVKPSQIADLLALKGDSVDNIPGAPGIGDKGAKDLIQRFGSVESAMERAAEVEKRTYRESLQNNRAQIELSKQLATIHTNVPVEWSPDALATREADQAALKTLYKEFEFFSLLKELGPGEDDGPKDYQSLDSKTALEEWFAAIPADAPVAIALAPASLLEPARAGLAFQPGSARGVDLEVLQDSPAMRRVTVAHDIKAVSLEAPQAAASLKEDVMLYGFILSADPGMGDLERLAAKYLDLKIDAGVEARADATLRLAAHLRGEMSRFRSLYDDIEFPLAAVLAKMERTGIRVDTSELGHLAARMDEEIQRLTASIHALAGKPFNINSPQQLGKILFEDLGLPAPVKAGKGKHISTAADVLDVLAEEHEIVAKVLEYRQVAKLKGTYVDALPALIRPSTGRVHTTFHQTGAATGRLSSSNPNLQNIPIRTELGREIRKAFIPQQGWKLVVADYSQIELRLLAHMSRDKVLMEAFRHNEDIHTRTAAEVFDVPPLMVTPEMRRDAKAVNFGIVYGQTPFGLAQALGIDRKQAEKYIASYFERYAGVRKFIDRTIEEVRKTGVSRTLLGRERPIPDINTRNPNARGFAERTAVNTPLQGTAADLMKIAMIRVQEKLKGLESRMLLQVHDELVLEAPPHEAAELAKMVKAEMENVFPLDVPLLVEAGIGENWRDAK